LPQAFGIPNMIVSDSDWKSKYYLPPRAFLGWNTHAAWTIGENGGPKPMPQNHKKFIENFITLWSGQGGQAPMTLGSALDKADQVVNYDPTQPNQPYEIGPLGSSIVRYGDPDLPFYQ